MIGGAPAAATVFAREVDARTAAGPAGARGGRAGAATLTGIRGRRGAGPTRRDHRGRPVREAQRSRRGIRPHPHRPAGARGGLGGPDHQRRGVAALHRRRLLERRACHRYSGRSSQECRGAASASTPGSPRAAGGGAAARVATVSRNRPSRRHQPGNTVPSTARTVNAPQPSSRGAARSGRPRACGCRDAARCATPSAHSPSPTKSDLRPRHVRHRPTHEPTRRCSAVVRKSPRSPATAAPPAPGRSRPSSGPVGACHANRPPGTVADRHPRLQRIAVDDNVWRAAGRIADLDAGERARVGGFRPITEATACLVTNRRSRYSVRRLVYRRPGQDGRLGRRQPLFVPGATPPRPARATDASPGSAGRCCMKPPDG